MNPQTPTPPLPAQPSRPTPVPPQPAIPAKPKKKIITKSRVIVLLVVFLFVLSNGGAYLFGKRNEKIVYRLPEAPPITLPPEAVVVAECVPGLGKQYVIPKDIPNGPIYDVVNSKVIAVEYNYKAIDIFADPTKLSKTILPLTENYKIDHFNTSIGELKAGTLQEAQSVPIHLTMYVVSKEDAQKIKCS